MALHQGPPAVVPGPVVPKLPAGPRNPNFAGSANQLNTVAEDPPSVVTAAPPIEHRTSKGWAAFCPPREPSPEDAL